MYYRSIQKLVLDRLNTALKNKKFKVVSEDLWKTNKTNLRIDAVLYKSENPVAVIEIKQSTKVPKDIIQAQEQAKYALTVTNSRFAIVTDNELFFLFDRDNKDEDFVKLGFDDIIKEILKFDEIKNLNTNKKKIIDIIKSAARTHLRDNEKIQSLFQEKSIDNHLIFERNKYSFHSKKLSFNPEDFENKIFNALFGEFKDKKICRYTSLDSAFHTLNNLTFRVNGIMGMNDRSEINYVDDYLKFDFNKNEHIEGMEEPLSKVHHKTVIAWNKRYLTSCTKHTRKDDLTLWRLYANDGKGVCLTFSIEKKNEDHKVLMHKVKYANKKSGKLPELDFIKEIILKTEEFTGFKFEFRYLRYWKHFFKPADYSIEEEVRILIIDNFDLKYSKPGWVKTHSHSILNPYIDFVLNDGKLPFKLTELMLGPKLPEQDLNKIQFEELIRRKKASNINNQPKSDLKGIKITKSTITHYR